MSNKPYIQNIFEASTCHITEKDDKLIARTVKSFDSGLPPYTNIIAYEYREGYFIYTFQVEEGEHLQETYKTLKEEGYSDEFLSLMKVARENGCKFLQLDADGHIHDDLHKFDW